MTGNNGQSSAAEDCGVQLHTSAPLSNGESVNCIPAVRKPLRVLVVDDDRDTASSMSQLVKIWGHEVWQAYDAASALDMARAYKPEVLLLDIGLPREDGCHLARQLRREAQLEHPLLIAVTGYGNEPVRLLCVAAGFDHVLIKPVEPAIVEQLLLREQDRLAKALEASLPPPRKQGILVVDDEESVRSLLGNWLRQHTTPVWLASDVREALELYWRHCQTIGVVLMDVRMPDLDGPQTLAALQELNPQICCCFMSGDLGNFTESGLLSAGAAAVIQKPVALTGLVPRLQELASKAERRTLCV